MRRAAFAVSLLLAFACGPTIIEARAGTYETLYEFRGKKDGYNPDQKLAIDKSGALYGVTTFGGRDGKGIVYRLGRPKKAGSAWQFEIIHDFGAGGRDGAYPVGPVTIGPDGALYGTTNNGGTASNAGVVFRLAAAKKGAWDFKTLRRMNAVKDGGALTSGLSFGSKGDVYGVAADGGKFDNGTVFRLAGGTKFEVLHAFKNAKEGIEPNSRVVVTGNGDILGTTVFGGPDKGLIYALDASAGYKPTMVHAYDLNSRPANAIGEAGIYVTRKEGRLIAIDSMWNFNRTAIFELKPPVPPAKAWTKTVLYLFPNEYHQIASGFAETASGSLYSVQGFGGLQGSGMIYRFDFGEDGSALVPTVVYQFGEGNTYDPSGGLVLGPDECLYGLTTADRVRALGTIYRFCP